jgi:transposase
MTGSSPKIEVLDGPQRRRHWTAAEKLSIVQETVNAGTSASINAVSKERKSRSYQSD